MQQIALSPKAVNVPGSPSPAKPCSNRVSPAKGMSPSPMMMMDYPATECVCPTCQYYKACYLYAQEAHSPEMHQAYQMYQYGYYPNTMSMPVTSPSPNHMTYTQSHSTAGSSPQQFTQYRGRSTSPTMQMPMVQMSGLAIADEIERSGNPVVEQFQSNLGNLAKLACTANGRSMLQAVMRLQHLDKIQAIFDELILDAEAVMLDQHGCHVVRLLIEVIDEHQLNKLMEVLHTKLILNMCTLSQYTRRILQTLFERHKSTTLQSIVDVMANNAQYLAATQQGCISLMRVFERCTAEQKHTIASPLLMSFADLACDPFGNYVVQCILDNSDAVVSSRYAMDCLSGHYLRLACNKFGSNVCEKLIRGSNPQIRRVMLDELIFNPAALQQLVSDGFGNFVVQTIVETCNSANELKKVCDRIRPLIAQSPYGHKIDAKIRSKRFPQGPTTNAPIPRRTQAPMAAF